MTQSLVEFKKLTNTEEYFEFFQLPYDVKVVNINRLHILKLFSQYMEEINQNQDTLSEAELLEQYEAALQKAYEVFLSTSPLETKLFKVFNEKPHNVVMLSEIK